ncbi:hypothetical protein CYMTET_13894 [Cymbomonas tetramitiformis]|uniref:Uncharacterized protein n=1 Tax=Cymbomonas tetramitiformis TaxID=36881 RepID=A0AAE0LAK1_9CHLO|nr:hypothetical protein CYMTET_13894 [Cymbomonas tetramitiformis]
MSDRQIRQTRQSSAQELITMHDRWSTGSTGDQQEYLKMPSLKMRIAGGNVRAKTHARPYCEGPAKRKALLSFKAPARGNSELPPPHKLYALCIACIVPNFTIRVDSLFCDSILSGRKEELKVPVPLLDRAVTEFQLPNYHSTGRCHKVFLLHDAEVWEETFRIALYGGIALPDCVVNFVRLTCEDYFAAEASTRWEDITDCGSVRGSILFKSDVIEMFLEHTVQMTQVLEGYPLGPGCKTKPIVPPRYYGLSPSVQQPFNYVFRGDSLPEDWLSWGIRSLFQELGLFEEGTPSIEVVVIPPWCRLKEIQQQFPFKGNCCLFSDTKFIIPLVPSQDTLSIRIGTEEYELSSGMVLEVSGPRSYQTLEVHREAPVGAVACLILHWSSANILTALTDSLLNLNKKRKAHNL